METVTATVQERVVDHVQILNPRALGHLEKQTVARISQIINANHIVTDYRTLQQGRCVRIDTTVIQSNRNSITRIRNESGRWQPR